MISTSTPYLEAASGSPEEDHVIYQYSVQNRQITKGNVTLSLFDFSKAEPVKNEISAPLTNAQNLIQSAFQSMISALENGNRPSINIVLSELNDAPKEDLFWIKASQITPSE